MIVLGTKCYKNNFDSKLYEKMADFCNSSISYQIEDKDEFYEIVERVIEEPSKKELLEREKSELETWLRKHANIKDMMYDEQVSCLFETDREDIVQTIQDLSRGNAKTEFVKDVLVEKEIIC